MKVKGTGIKATYNFVKENYPDLLSQWIEQMPAESKQIYENPIYSTQWYDLHYGYTEPTKILAELLGKKPEEIAEDLGSYSARTALKTVYTIFLKVARLRFAFRRIPSFFAAYYDPIYVEVKEIKSNQILIDFGYVPMEDTLLYNRNKGWMKEFIKQVEQPSVISINFELFPSPNNNKLYGAKFKLNWE